MGKSKIQFICPVSGARTLAPLSEDFEGVFVPVEEEDDASGVALPLGWGRLVLDVVVTNPEFAAAEQRRAEQTREGMEAAVKLAKAPVPKSNGTLDDDLRVQQAAEFKRRVANGEIEAAVRDQVDASIPMPESVILVRLSFPVLGPDAVGTALKALRDAGFPIATPEPAPEAGA